MQKRTVTVLAPAKLNLSLDVVGTLPNGYHDLDMVMQTIDLYEKIILKTSRDLRLSLPGSFVPANGRQCRRRRCAGGAERIVRRQALDERAVRHRGRDRCRCAVCPAGRHLPRAGRGRSDESPAALPGLPLCGGHAQRGRFDP